jgi:hypothetical protein
MVLDFVLRCNTIYRMDFVFIQTHGFRKEAVRLGLSLDDLRAIENQISDAPHRWPVISGAPGLRKMRFAPEGRSGGKSGGVRICYFVMDAEHHVFLVTIFAKNEKQNLNAADRNAIKAWMTRIRKSYEE